MLTWLMTVTYVTIFGLYHVHLLPAFFWNVVFVTLYFLDVAQSNKVSLLSFLNSSPNLPVGVSIGFGIFPYLRIEVSHHYRVVVWFP